MTDNPPSDDEELEPSRQWPPIGRCLGCRHDFSTGPCGGCGAVDDGTKA